MLTRKQLITEVEDLSYENREIKTLLEKLVLQVERLEIKRQNIINKLNELPKK